MDHILDWFCSYTGGKFAVYHMARHSNQLTESPYVRTNYPARWIQRYLLKGYIRIDPVVVRGFKSALPFFWDELKVSSKEEIAFFDDAVKHGVGISGLSIPVCDKANRRAMVSINSDRDPKNWRKSVSGMLSSLADCSNYLHQKIVGEEFGRETSEALLSPREIECLSWTANGKDCGTISLILGLSEHTVRDYLKSARFKLGCVTLPQAVGVATEKGILVNYA